MDLANKYGSKTYSSPKPKSGPSISVPTIKASVPISNVVGSDAGDLPDDDSVLENSNHQTLSESLFTDDYDDDHDDDGEDDSYDEPPQNHQLEDTWIMRTAIDDLAVEKIADSCRKCNATFDNEWRLANHIKIKHSNYIDPCPLTSRAESELKGAKRDFKCPTCSFKLYTIQGLAKHTLDAHGKETIDPETKLPVEITPYKQKKYPSTTAMCDQCGKLVKTTGKSELRLHILSVHTPPEGRPYPCDFDGCSSSYCSPSRLVQHRRRHKDLKLYSCPHENCGKEFFMKVHLKNHLQAVHKDKGVVFKCKLCGHESKSKTGREYHVKKFHGKKDRKCPHCDFVTLTNGNLRLHIKNMHKETLDENGKVSKEDEAKLAKMSAKYKPDFDTENEDTASPIQVDDHDVQKSTKHKTKTTIEVDTSDAQPVPSKTLNTPMVQPAQYNNHHESYFPPPSCLYQSTGHVVDTHYCQMCENYFTDLSFHYQNYHRISSARYLNALINGQQSYSY